MKNFANSTFNKWRASLEFRVGPFNLMSSESINKLKCSAWCSARYEAGKNPAGSTLPFPFFFILYPGTLLLFFVVMKRIDNSVTASHDFGRASYPFSRSDGIWSFSFLCLILFCFFDASFISVDGGGGGGFDRLRNFPLPFPHVVSNWVLFGGDFGTDKVIIITIYS